MLIGLGSMGRKYLSKFKELNLKPTLCDLNPALREEFKEFEFYCFYDEIETAPEKVFVVVNPEHHPKIARHFLERESFVFLEKPPALKRGDFESLIRNFGTDRLAVSEIERYSAAVKGFKPQGVKKISIKRLNPRRGYINPFWDIGWHDFYLLLHLFGDFEIEKHRRLGKYRHLVSGIAGGSVPFEYELAWEHTGEVKRFWELETESGKVVLDFLNERRIVNGKTVSERTGGDKLLEMVSDVLEGSYDTTSTERALKILEKLEGLEGKGGI